MTTEPTSASDPAPIAACTADRWQSRLAATFRRPFWILSPTWGLANVLKPE